LEKAGQMRVVVIINGSGRFKTEGQENVGFGSGDTVLLPAAYEGVMCLDEDTEYLRMLAPSHNE